MKGQGHEFMEKTKYPNLDTPDQILKLPQPPLVMPPSGEGKIIELPDPQKAKHNNVDLFDEAGLNYPPSSFDEKYVMPDGSEVDWNYDTVAEIAKILTVDANGNDATSADFDPGNIVQYDRRNPRL